MNKTEYWLSGPVEAVPALLQPVAHALLQAKAEIEEAMNDFPENLLWTKPAGVASVAFHLQHIPGVLDRLFTYAKGEQLSQAQLDYLSKEGKDNPAIKLQELLDHLSKETDRAIEYLKQIKDDSLLQPRGVGRKQLPSNVLGLLFHSAEHAQRHTGQLLVTAKVLKEGYR
jgi:uncharacterized damage-inducible protein DinB